MVEYGKVFIWVLMYRERAQYDVFIIKVVKDEPLNGTKQFLMLTENEHVPSLEADD